MFERTRPPVATIPAPAGLAEAGEPDGGLVMVTSGLYADRFPVTGMTVAAVRSQLADRLDIDPAAVAVIDGRIERDQSVTIRAGQHVAFVRPAGEKGRAARWSRTA